MRKERIISLYKISSRSAWDTFWLSIPDPPDWLVTAAGYANMDPFNSAREWQTLPKAVKDDMMSNLEIASYIPVVGVGPQVTQGILQLNDGNYKDVVRITLEVIAAAVISKYGSDIVMKAIPKYGLSALISSNAAKTTTTAVVSESIENAAYFILDNVTAAIKDCAKKMMSSTNKDVVRIGIGLAQAGSPLIMPAIAAAIPAQAIAGTRPSSSAKPTQVGKTESKAPSAQRPVIGDFKNYFGQKSLIASMIFHSKIRGNVTIYSEDPYVTGTPFIIGSSDSAGAFVPNISFPAEIAAGDYKVKYTDLNRNKKELAIKCDSERPVAVVI